MHEADQLARSNFRKNTIINMRKHTCLLLLLFGIFVLFLSQPTMAQEANSESEGFIIAPYVGYNNAAGYGVDLEEVYEEDLNTEEEIEDEADEIASVKGGIVLGVGAEFALSYGRELFDLKIRPAIETAFVSGDQYSDDYEDGGVEVEEELSTSQRYIQLSGDLIAEFSQGASITPYAGAGLTYVSHSGEVTEEGSATFSDGDTDSFSGSEDASGTAIGLNILGGARFPGTVDFGVPFAQLRATLADPTSDDLTDLDAPGLGTAITLTVGVNVGL